MTARAYRIRPEAEKDLKEVARYTRRTWGQAQARKYLRALHERMQALAANPNLGVARHDVADGYRSARIGHHHVFYSQDGDTIVVVRVLHESMDVQRHVEMEQELEVLGTSPKAKSKKRGRGDDLSR